MSGTVYDQKIQTPVISIFEFSNEYLVRIWIDPNLISECGCGQGLYANVDQSPLSGLAYVTAVDQSGVCRRTGTFTLLMYP